MTDSPGSVTRHATRGVSGLQPLSLDRLCRHPRGHLLQVDQHSALSTHAFHQVRPHGSHGLCKYHDQVATSGCGGGACRPPLHPLGLDRLRKPRAGSAAGGPAASQPPCRCGRQCCVRAQFAGSWGRHCRGRLCGIGPPAALRPALWAVPAVDDVLPARPVRESAPRAGGLRAGFAWGVDKGQAVRMGPKPDCFGSPMIHAGRAASMHAAPTRPAPCMRPCGQNLTGGIPGYARAL